MPQILITIDTEIGELGKNKPDAFETFIEGKINDREVGYRFIMDVLDKYDIRGEFFVDVYPYEYIGESKFANLCINIAERGHNVQLHTHPAMAFDRKRIYMHQYSFEEQVKILELGKHKIKDWIGKYPIVHRAGGYGINENTFRALEKVGIHYDSSYFYKNTNCKFQTSVKNKLFKVGNIIEIPVTVFEKIVDYKILGIKILNKERFRKLDIKYGATVSEIQEAISKSSKNDIIILFLHSFNFLNLPYNFSRRKYGTISINDMLIEKFKKLLDWISLQENCKFVTFDTLKMDSSQKDAFIKISQEGNILKETYNFFRYKVLKTRKS